MYIDWCFKYQEHEESNYERFTSLETLVIPERRWRTPAADFIIGLLETKDGVHSVKTSVDKF